MPAFFAGRDALAGTRAGDPAAHGRLICLGVLALVLVALTGGRLGYQRYREEVPDPATALT
jgi:hypothetical protein